VPAASAPPPLPSGGPGEQQVEGGQVRHDEAAGGTPASFSARAIRTTE
jgi:hypothetical protein